MDKICSSHNKRITILCSEKGCNSYQLCIECLRSHDLRHISFLISVEEVFSKDGSLNIEKELKPIYDKNISVADCKIREITDFITKIVGYISSFFDEFQSKINKLIEKKKETLLKSIRNYLLKDLTQIELEKEKFIKENDYSKLNTPEVYLQYLRKITDYSKIYLQKEAEEFFIKMNQMNGYLTEFNQKKEDQLNKLDKFFNEENLKFHGILNTIKQTNSYKLTQGYGELIVHDAKKSNFFLFDKKTMTYTSSKSLSDISIYNPKNFNHEFNDILVHDDVFYIVDRSNRLKVVKDGIVVKDHIFDMKILKIHLTLENNILIVMSYGDKKILFKIYDLYLQNVNSKDFISNIASPQS